MKEYEDMSYFHLKSECAKIGIKSKGTKDELLERIKNTKFPTPIEEQEIIASPPKGKSKEIESPQGESIEIGREEEKIEENKTNLASPHLPQNTVPIDDQRFDPWLKDARLESLSSQLISISAGKGKFRFVIDREAREFQVEFSGKMQGLYSTTLIDSDNRIVREAGYYFNARYKKGTNGQINVQR